MASLEAVRQALRLLRAHKTRSLLTLFGLVWGTAAVILPCDQPRVTRALLDELVAHYLASDKPIVACAYAGIVGAPALVVDC